MRCGLGFGRWSLRRGWGGKLALVALRSFNFEVPFSATSGHLLDRTGGQVQAELSHPALLAQRLRQPIPDIQQLATHL